jgi:hypothetical protein
MIIIRSKVGKSKTKVLLEFLKKVRGNKIIFNSEFDQEDFIEIANCHGINLKREVNLMDCDYIYIQNRNNFNNLIKFLYLPHEYKYVVFYFNESIHNISHYKQLESEIKATIILAVQEHADSSNEEVLIQKY